MRKYRVGRHRIVICEDKNEWTEIIEHEKPVDIKLDKDGFTIDWS